MDQETLQLFCRQLAYWAETAIAHGRFPFRKVEVSPLLLSQGEGLRPPLVFWINRDSFMAGGVLFFPTEETAQEVARGQQCARALGLRHFVTWSSRDIVFWEDRQGTVFRHRTIPLEAAAETGTEGFQTALGQILEELKILSVTGAISPNELEADYFANLCRGAVQDAYPFLVEIFRATEGENRSPFRSPSATDLAYQKGMLTLVRILALILFDHLPVNVQPENLERAMRFALESLPIGVRETWQQPFWEQPLPPESAVRFHHLFRRLTQLRWREDPLRARHVLEVILEFEGNRMGGNSLPFPAETKIPGELRIHPDRLYPDGEDLLEVSSAPILAFTALLRTLAGRPPALRQTTDLFNLPASSSPTLVRGTLADEYIPPPEERRVLTARLRVSWPTRRFIMPPKTPRWVWHFLHLLGLAQPLAPIELTLPDGWLTADYGFFLWESMKTQGTLECLAREPRKRVRLRLIKGVDRPGPALITGPEGPRHLPFGLISGANRSLLPLALDLGGKHFALVESGLLRTRGKADWPVGKESEVFLFSRSSWGRALWAIIAGDAPLPDQENMRAEGLRYGFPLPSEEILESLQLLALNNDGKIRPDQHQVDRKLAHWLGDAPSRPEQTVKKSGVRSAVPTSRKLSATDELAKEISREVFVDGVPRFPEQYLYGYYRPQVREYQFSGPLVCKEEFFGQTLLRDEEGRSLRVESRETARALILASYSGRLPVLLPVDHRLTSAIVDRYLDDLQILRQSLMKQTHIRLADPKTADSLVEKIWSRLTLPPWKLIES